MLIRRFSALSLEKIKNFRLKFLESVAKPPRPDPKPIKIKYAGQKIEGYSYETTPLSIASQFSLENPLAAVISYEKSVGLEVYSAEGEQILTDHGQLCDLSQPILTDCSISFIYFNDPLGKSVFWHSTSHVLGLALEQFKNGLLTNGPSTTSGFYYDIDTQNSPILPSDLPIISEIMQKTIEKKYLFEKFIITKAQALELFAYNPYKKHFIQSKIPNNSFTSIYKLNDFVDLCAGPHVLHTGIINSFKLTDTSSTYWLGKSTEKTLQRVYGISFPDSHSLSSYFSNLSEIQKRDHRKTGSDLYFWHAFSAGSAFFLPEGTEIYNKLINFMRKEYRYRGFTEVISPNLFNNDLWKKSGHYYKYKSDMYLFSTQENEEIGLKPMNCPGHCLIFDHVQRSYKELPLRFAEFGVLHRNEISGSLSGLTRVRRFVQDDSHIFCRADQIKSEVTECLNFVEYIYKVLGFQYEIELSTKPKNALGSDEIWEKAETQLQEALNDSGIQWKENKGDGAFYGPKIDIKVKDAMGRAHQCGTIQLDFNLPKRFNLQFRTENSEEKNEQDLVKYEDFEESNVRQGFDRPVIIHRAVLGSIERMIAILTEHYAGKWPFWLSPRQIMLVCVGESVVDYAEKVKNRLKIEGFCVDIDFSNTSLNKKIRNAQLKHYNFIGVIGKDEVSLGVVDIRDRDTNKNLGKFKIDSLIEMFNKLDPEKSQSQIKMEQNSFFNDSL